MANQFQHDSLANEENAARAHFAMKWGYRAHNALLMAIQLYVVLLTLPLWLKVIGVVLLSLGIWINGESAQWHARATDDHLGRANALRG